MVFLSGSVKVDGIFDDKLSHKAPMGVPVAGVINKITFSRRSLEGANGERVK
jgi:hypothetical protein